MGDAQLQPPNARDRLYAATGGLLALSIVVALVNFLVWTAAHDDDGSATLFLVLALAQLAAGVGALVCGIRVAARNWSAGGDRLGPLFLGLLGGFIGLCGLLAIWLNEGLKNFNPVGSGWGRPLRVRGRILHPGLRAGSDWTQGARPDAGTLDDRTCAALEALWLHDAKKEHASVPAFARISWLLAAVGAPAELVEGAHRAALQEIDHARRCFALAAGYGRQSHSVEPMADLLVGGLEMRGDPFSHMAVESLTDGCLLEDFNADVAAACESVCEEPVVKDVLARIATEERSHAAFSWDLLEWLVARGGPAVVRAVEKAAGMLAETSRPPAVSGTNSSVVARADARRMRAHGRLEDAEWQTLWNKRLVETRLRVGSLLARSVPRAA